MKINLNYLKTPAIIIFLGLIFYFPLFHHLDRLPIRIWDESRQAINAYEMSKDGDYLVTHFEGQDDNWNTKPPLLIWFQVFFIKLIGCSEIAIRLPSAIAALFTCLLLIYFSREYFGKAWYGVISSIVLITMQGFVDTHVARTGDYDAMLTFFSVSAVLMMFLYTSKEKNFILYLFFIFLTLAVLTKGIAAMFYMPAVFLFVLFKGKIVQLIKNKHFYFGLLIFSIFAIGYYFLRELVSPGYIQAMISSEIGPRFSETIPDHQQPTWFYFNFFIDNQLIYWYWFFPVGLTIGFIFKEFRTITIYSFILLVFFFTLITLAKTKIEWYSAPMYPLLAIIISIPIIRIIQWFQNKEFFHKLSKTKSKIILSFILIAIFFYPYKKIIEKTFNPKEAPWHIDFYEPSRFFRDALYGKYNIDNALYLAHRYCPHYTFYINLLNDQGANIKISNWDEVKVNDTIILNDQWVLDSVQTRFNIKPIYELNITKMLVVSELKIKP